MLHMAVENKDRPPCFYSKNKSYLCTLLTEDGMVYMCLTCPLWIENTIHVNRNREK